MCAAKAQTTKKECCGSGCGDCPESDEGMERYPTDEEIFTKGLDVGKLVLLSVLSSGTYHIYWMYRNWKHLKEYKHLTIKPMLRAGLLILPVVDIVLSCLQFKRIHALAREENRRAFPLLWTCIGYGLFIVLSWFFFVMVFIATGNPYLGLGLFFFEFVAIIFMTLILLPVQYTLNDIWTHAEPKKILRTSYTNGEIAWIVIGSILLLLSMYSMFSPPEFPLDDYYAPPAGAEQQLPPLDTPSLDDSQG